MEIKNVAVLGRGAVGTLFGDIIHRHLGKEHFCFIGEEERVARYKKESFYLNHQVTDFRYAANVEEFHPVDLLIISVKYPVLLTSLEAARSFVKEDTIILTLLNGITSESLVEKALQKGIVIHSIAQLMDAVKDEHGVIYSNTGEIVLGTPNPTRTDALHDVVTFFDKVKLPYRISKDILHDQWSKLMLNCGINQVCAVFNVGYGGCQKEGKLRELFIATMKEVQNIAIKEGIVLTNLEIENWVKAVDRLNPEAMPSMRQDMLAHRYSEVDLFSKTMIDLAKIHHMDVPINTMLYEKIKAKENKF